MAVCAFVSQKGGVGKSTLARALARELAAAGLAVKIADLDVQQTTTADWHRARLANDLSPAVPVEAFSKARDALRIAPTVDYLVIDGPARTSAATLELAQAADLVVHPTGASLDDLRPAVRAFHELTGQGIPGARLAFALCRVGTPAEESDARDYLAESGYHVLAGVLQEKPAYRQAQNAGRSVTETPYKQLNERADQLLQAIVDRLVSNLE